MVNATSACESSVESGKRSPTPPTLGTRAIVRNSRSEQTTRGTSWRGSSWYTGRSTSLWGPNELKDRWLPALRDGLWHHDVRIDADDVEVCFYGDLFRRAPGTDAERRLEQSRAGIAEAMSEHERRRRDRRPRPGGE